MRRQYVVPMVGLMRCFLLGFLLVSSTLTYSATRQTSGPRATERDSTFRRYFDFPSYVDGGDVQAHWLRNGSSFWYAADGANGREIFRVDPSLGTKESFFDTTRLREVLSAALGHEPEVSGVPFASFDLEDDGSAIEFPLGAQKFRLNLADYSIQEVPSSNVASSAEIKNFPDPLWPCCPQRELLSPDASQVAGIEDNNVYVRSVDSDEKTILTDDGTPDAFWTFSMWSGGQAQWSPDSSKLAVLRGDIRDSAYIPIVSYEGPVEAVEMVPFPYGNGVQPKRELYVIDVESGERRQLEIGNAILGWHPDSSELFVLDQPDDHNSSPATMLAVDSATGLGREVLDSLFIRSAIRFLPELELFLWTCESDGWRHYCIYDLNGERQAQLTGNYWVERIVAVDEEAGWVYFAARGDEDRIYDTHLYRVTLDGEQLQQLTQEPGRHNVQLSPSMEYFIDSHSTPSRAPQVDLRSVDGRFLMTLTTARTERLKDQLRWEPPEGFIVKSADGVTDIHGVLYKPYDFDPQQSYPVIQFVYGSGFSIVPHAFIPDGPLGGIAVAAQARAQLGYITVLIDARGSSGRDLAFGSGVWETPGALETADYAAALRELAETRSYMDLGRVGVTGGSYGGYLALQAILSRPQVYKAAVVTAGITELPRHINRTRLPANDSEAFEYASTLRLAENLEGKLLLIHGTADDAVPLGHTMRMVDALIQADKRFDLLIMPGESHETNNIWSGYGLEAELDFFAEHLKP